MRFKTKNPKPEYPLTAGELEPGQKFYAEQYDSMYVAGWIFEGGGCKHLRAICEDSGSFSFPVGAKVRLAGDGGGREKVAVGGLKPGDEFEDGIGHLWVLLQGCNDDGESHAMSVAEQYAGHFHNRTTVTPTGNTYTDLTASVEGEDD